MVPSKSLNPQVAAYKKAFASGEIQETYQNLVGIVQSLRTKFAREYKGDYSVANVLHGYIDFTYFYLQNDYLKRNKLKLAIVLNHQYVHFELWLLGQTKDVQVRYWEELKCTEWVNQEVMPKYSIFEISLVANPDFDDVKGLSEYVQQKFESFSKEIINTLKAIEKCT